MQLKERLLMRKLNVKFFLLLVGITVAVTGGFVLAHHLQYKRIPPAILHQATLAEDEGDLKRASMYLARYLEFAPEDAEQWARLGTMLSDKKIMKTFRRRQQALFVLQKALAKDPSQQDLRRKTILLALDLTRINDAKEHLSGMPKGAERSALEGRIYEADKDIPNALMAYEAAIKANVNQVDIYLRRAKLLREQRFTNLTVQQAQEQMQNNHQLADKLINEMVTNNPENWEARVGRWNWYRTHRPEQVHSNPAEFQKLVSDINKALELAPGQSEVRLAAAELAQIQGDLKAARTHMDKALQLHKKDPTIYRAYAGLEIQAVQDEKNDKKKAAGHEKARAWLRLGIQELKGQDQFEVLWAYATILLDHGGPKEFTEAESVIDRIRQAHASPAGVNFLQARLLFNRQQWALAAKLLESARPNLESSAQLANQIDILLGRCYVQLDSPRKQYETYRRLASRKPDSVLAHFGMANAARALGQLEDAMTHYRKLGQLQEAPRGIWTERARILIAQARQSQATNRWQPVEQILTKAEEYQKKLTETEEKKLAAVEIGIVRAEYLLARGEVDKARQTIDALRQKNPERVELWVALAALTERTQKSEEVLPLLIDAEKHMKRPMDKVELRLAKARYYAKQEDGKFKSELKQLQEGWQDLETVERSRLLNGLAEANYRAGNLKEAADLWDKLTQERTYQGDLRLRLVLFDLALQQNDDSRMKEILEAINKLEGGEGAFSRHATALRLLWQVEQGQIRGNAVKAQLEQASELLNMVKESRPGWPAVELAKAQIEELRMNPLGAIEHYREARRLGDRNPLVVRKYVEALREQNRFQEADNVLKSMSPQDLLGNDLGRLAAILALDNHDSNRAAWWAMKTVQGQSRNYRDHLWLGQVLIQSGQYSEKAEEHIREAIKLDEQKAGPWLALVELYSKQENGEVNAILAIKEAEQKLPKDKVDLVLARAYDLINKDKEAEHHYKAALKNMPNAPEVLKNVARRALQQGRLQEAEPLLKRMVTMDSLPEADAEWAQGNLALLLSAGDDFGRFQEALQWTGLMLDGEGKVVSDPKSKSSLGNQTRTLQLQARVLATQPGWKTREAAIERFEDLDRNNALSIQDRFILAQLYDKQGNWAKTQGHLSALARQNRVPPQYLSFYAQRLLEQKEVNEAERIIRKLEAMNKAKPNRPIAIATTELKSRMYEARGEADKSIQLIQKRLKEEDSQPEEILLLLHAYARQRKFDEAQKLIDKVWETCAPEVAGGVMVAILRATTGDDQAREQVISRFEAATVKHPKNAILHVQLGDVYDHGGDYEKAEESYRNALKFDPKNVMALNNLAWLLAQRSDKGQEAEQLINRAIEAVGPRGQLLDTRAIVYLKLKKHQEAVNDLENAITEKKSGTRSFHLARVYDAMNDQSKVKSHLQEAKDQKLTVSQLHPVEQSVYTDMLKKYLR